MPLLLNDPYCTVSQEPSRSVLRFTRTDLPYASLDDVVEVHERIARIFDRVGRSRYLLLVDMRRAPLNNKAEFEHAAARARGALIRGFGRVAVLVQTAVGALQVGRHLRQDGVPGEVFSDEAQALAYLARFELETPPQSAVAPLADGPFRNLTGQARKR